MRKFVTSFLRDDSGASAAEYALILAIVGAAIVVGAITLSTAVSKSMTDAASCIGNPVSSNTAC